MSVHYPIKRKLGKGTFGVVYHMNPNGKDYALKVVKTAGAATSEFALRESQLMLQLEHPHILQCYWVGVYRQEYLFMLLEYCGRGTLTNAIKERVSEQQAVIWFIQMADALKYLHSNRVMHRDIKPDNILLNQNNHIKLGDLGLARQQEFTAQGGATFAGTACYMSPQILQGQPYKDKTDVWSLGCVFHEVLTQSPPFSYEDLFPIINGPTPPMPLSYREGLRMFIFMVLNRDEMSRPTAEQVFQALIQLSGAQYHPQPNIPHQAVQLDTESVFTSVLLYDSFITIANALVHGNRNP